MAKFISLVEGFNILAKHVDSDKDFAQAEHDEIYLPGPSPQEMPPEDVSRLEELGFRWDKHNDSWHVFT